MSAPARVRFEDLWPKYRAVFFDASGVLKTAENLYEGVPEMLARLRQRGVFAYLLSNDASKSIASIAAKYVLKGQEREPLFPEPRVITSGRMATRFWKEHHRGAKIAYLGPEGCVPYIEEADCVPVDFTRVSDPHAFDLFALMDNGGYDWRRELNRVVNLVGARSEVPLFAPNPDLVYPVPGGGVNIASGAMAHLLGTLLGREFHFFGKPHRSMFEYALATAGEEISGLRPEECLMVGDTLETDIRGAGEVGIDTLLVLTGNATEGDYLERTRKTGIIPRFISPGVVD